MSDPASDVCHRCGKPAMAPGACLKCLLDSGLSGDDKSLGERIFQAALSMDPSERSDFIHHAAAGDAGILAEVEMLLEGYAEAGGDEAAATLGGTARIQWASARREEPGTVIDHFRLVKIIGEGGMGSVWEAEQNAPIRRRVALKIIKLGMDTEEVVKRFERERRTLALMAHPHIAQVYEAGATPAGRPYFAMELVDGTAITQHCEQVGLALRDRLGLFLDVCAAVEHAHQKGVIHRDLKPSNILVADGAVKVIDFGIAKATQESADGLLTQQAQVLGTPAYMSPEQAESNGTDVDTRTDVYSLGVVLYELLSGALPFDPVRLAGTHLGELQRILREEEPPRPSTRPIPMPVRKTDPSRKPDASPAPQPPTGIHPAELRNDLDWIVMKALSKERARRYPSAASFAADVRRFLAGEAVRAVPPTLAYRFGKFVRRNKAAVAAVAGIVLALSAGLIISLRQVQRTNEALTEAQTARTDATNTVADMYARSGFAAAESDDPSRAALWFAEAAIIGGKDPDRVAANRIRVEAWARDNIRPVSAIPTDGITTRLSWHPRLPVLIEQQENAAETSARIWKIPQEERWQPALAMRASEWSPGGEWIAARIPEGVLAVIEYPSGNEVARFTNMPRGTPAWSPDGRWILIGDQLLDWRDAAARPVTLPSARCRFSREGGLLLVQLEETTGICPVTEPGRYLHPPVPSVAADNAQFLGKGDRYLVTSAQGELVIHDSTTGGRLASHQARDNQFSPDYIVAATSPDGRYVARRNLPVLDLQTGQSKGWPLHKAVFGSQSFSPDSQRLASAGFDSRVELGYLNFGDAPEEAGHHHTSVLEVAFSGDGRLLASAERGLIFVWDTQPQLPVRSVSAAEASTLCAISADGRFMAPSGFTNRYQTVTSTRLYHLPGGDPAGPEITPGGAIMDVLFSPDASWIAIAVATTPDRGDAAFSNGGGGTGNIQFWNPHTGERLGDSVTVPSEPRGLSLHPSGTRLGVCCAADGLEIDTVSRAVRHFFRNAYAQAPAATLNNGRCRYSPDGRIFAAWGTNEFTRLWDIAAGRDLIEPYRQETTTFDLDMHGDTVAIPLVNIPMRIEFRNLRTGAEAAPTLPFTGWPFVTRFSEDGSLLLAASGERTAHVLDWRTGRLVCPAFTHTDAIMAGLMVPGTPWVITGSHDGFIKFWDRRTGMMIRPPIQHGVWVLGLQLTPDARTLISTGHFGGKIFLFDLPGLLPAPDADPALLKLRAELAAGAEVHPGGGLAPLTQQAWMEKWRNLRAAERAAAGAGGGRRVYHQR